MRWIYRFWQFGNALWAKPQNEDYTLIRQLLTPELAQLFSTLDRSEQAHAIRVCRKLLNDGESDITLLTAALLHDIGKTKYRLSLWERVWIVLFAWIEKRFGIKDVSHEDDLDQSTWWIRPLYVGRYHPRWGAELLRQFGVDEQVVWLVQHHQDGNTMDDTQPLVDWLRKLKQADQSS
ncbi:MAG: HD domain-containing protein [Anaerolineales bacterium]